VIAGFPCWSPAATYFKPTAVPHSSIRWMGIGLEQVFGHVHERIVMKGFT